jgi:hypothetical protein
MFYRADGEPTRYAVCTENGPQTLNCDSLLGDAPAD